MKSLQCRVDDLESEVTTLRLFIGLAIRLIDHTQRNDQEEAEQARKTLDWFKQFSDKLKDGELKNA